MSVHNVFVRADGSQRERCKTKYNIIQIEADESNEIAYDVIVCCSLFISYVRTHHHHHHITQREQTTDVYGNAEIAALLLLL